MSANVIFVKSLNGQEINEFFTKIYASTEISKDFMVTRLDATAIRDVLQNHIIECGISSLFRFSITCDAVIHPGIHVDEIEKVILGFVRKLNAAKNLLIIDPYFYSNKPDTLNLFEKMMSELSEKLETVTLITNGKNANCKSAMHGVLKNVMPAVLIEDVVTDEFHDRFWIDLDNLQGIVMGTSLNGITKKICLVDHISDADVRQIVGLAKPLLLRPQIP
ncbi:MAG: hypothetical protein ACYC3N_00035 [Halothiobacillus sp.]|jgi:hypothetical protein|nr:MAG: hypothetical protein B7X29_04385 [Halothiobacillus sp. 13-55-115]